MKATASYANILKIAAPIMVGMLTQNIMQITNTAFLGRLGDAGTGETDVALGVSAMAGLYYFLITMLAFGFANGAQVMIARRSGEGKPEEIGNIFNHTLFIMLWYAVFSFVMIFVMAPLLLEKFIHNPVIFEKSMSFLHYRAYGVIFSILIICFNSFYIGVGRTKVIMYGTVASTVVNIFFDYSLIFGNFGFPKLNTDGAAISSVIAEAIGLLVLVINVMMNDYGSTMKLFRKSVFQFSLFKQLLNLSMPLVVQYAFSMGAWYLFFITIEHMGAHSLAISNIIRSILFMFTISCWAIGSSCNSLVSNIMGQQKNYQVYSLIRKAVLLSVGISFTMAMLLAVFAKPIMHIYTTDLSIINDAVHPIYVLCCGIVMLSIATVLFQGVQGTGSTTMNLLTELAAVAVYCGYVFGVVKYFNLNLTWAWMSELVYWISIASISLIYLRSGRWKKKVI